MVAELRHVAETGSTNDDVRRWIMEGVAHGTALRADAQTAGRGRLGRQWYSPARESLYLSVAIVGSAYIPLLPMIPLAVGVAVAERLRDRTGLEVGLKWPNDLWLAGRKLGGILCEGVFVGERYAGAVVGLGLNVHTDLSTVPPELHTILTSLRAHTGERYDLGGLAAALQLDIITACEQLRAVGPAPMIRRWRGLDVSVGRDVVLADGTTGIARGVADDGALRVETPAGLQLVRSGEVVFRPAR